MTYSGGVSIPRIPSLNAGLSVDATLWQQDERQGVFGGVYVTRSFGSVYSRLGYRYNKSPLFNAGDIVTNGLEGLIQLPLNRRASFTIQASTNFNDRLSSSRIYTALWVRL